MPKCACCGTGHGLFYDWDSKTTRTDLNGQKICYKCMDKLASQQLQDIAKLNASYDSSSTIAKPLKRCNWCAFSSKTTLKVEKQSLTNSLTKLSNTISPYGNMGALEYDFVDRWACSKFGFELNSFYKAENCASYITHEDYEKKCLSGEMDKEKQAIQIILDFSSLKDAMSKGGLVMTTYKCPNCNGMVDLPEAGKVLICKYCGTPIKPVDIFEKIKSLMQ